MKNLFFTSFQVKTLTETMVQIIILAILLQASRIDAYKILVLYPFPSFSHQQPMMVLTEGLVKRGHQVFSVTPNGMSVSSMCVSLLQKHHTTGLHRCSAAYAVRCDWF